jgi:hypothetical protein
MVGAQHVSAFRHEMHAAEHDEFGVRVTADLLRELVGVAGIVGVLDDLVALIMMTENDQTPTQSRPGRGDAPVHFCIGQADIAIGQRLAFGQMFLLVRSQNGQQHGWFDLLRTITPGPAAPFQAAGAISQDRRNY